MLHERLDSETARQWELVRESDTPKVDQMLAFLDKQALALANSASNRRRIESAVAMPDRGKQPNPIGARDVAAFRPTVCEVCNDNHMLYHFPEFMGLTLKARKEYVVGAIFARTVLRKSMV